MSSVNVNGIAICLKTTHIVLLFLSTEIYLDSAGLLLTCRLGYHILDSHNNFLHYNALLSLSRCYCIYNPKLFTAVYNPIEEERILILLVVVSIIIIIRSKHPSSEQST